MTDNDGFCPQCGQKAIYNNLSVKNLFKKFVDSFLNFDVKLLRSIRDVWIPNKMVKEYVAGSRSVYIHPFRFYFVTLIIFFALLSINLKNSSFGTEDIAIQKYEVKKHDKFVSNRPFLDSIAGKAIIDSVEQKLFKKYIIEENLGNINFNIGAWDFSEYNISGKDKITLKPDSIIRKYKVEGKLKQIILKQEIKTEQDPGNMIRHAISNMLWGIILITVIMSFVLKLLYIRHDAYLVEHFLHISHFHCLTLLLLSALLLYDIFGYTPESLFGFSILLGSLHFLYSLKSYYGQGFFKTFIKAIFIFFAYIFALSLVMVIIFLFTVLFL